MLTQRIHWVQSGLAQAIKLKSPGSQGDWQQAANANRAGIQTKDAQAKAGGTGDQAMTMEELLFSTDFLSDVLMETVGAVLEDQYLQRQAANIFTLYWPQQLKSVVSDLNRYLSERHV